MTPDKAKPPEVDRKPVERIATKFPPLDPAWAKKVQSLKPAEQLREVERELKRRHANWQGTVSGQSEGKAVKELLITSDVLADLTPVQALPGWVRLQCFRSAPGKGQLEDLSPLRGLSLTSLNVRYNPVRDLAPLAGMQLTFLNIAHSRVTDLAVLRTMPLIGLFIEHAPVTDYSPLRALVSLRELRIGPGAFAAAVRSLPQLATINGTPVAAFWKEHDAKKP